MTLGYDYAFKRFQCRHCRSDVTGFLMAKRALEACEDYFDQRTTAEMLPDGPSANEEGQLLVEVGEALHELRRAGDCPECRHRRDSDGTATAAANGDLPVPQDCQARAESIAQPHPKAGQHD
jgi:hypothetical protein